MNLKKKTVKMPTTPVNKITFNDIATNAASLYLSVSQEINYVDSDAVVDDVVHEEVGGAQQMTTAITVIGKSIMEFVPAVGFEMALFIIGAALKKINDNPSLHSNVTIDTICGFAAVTNAAIISSANNLVSYHNTKEEQKKSSIANAGSQL